VAPYPRDLLTRQAPPPYPYLASFERRGRRLAYVAADHDYQPNGPTHALVQRVFEAHAPRAVIVEGFATSRGAGAMNADITSARPSSWAQGEAGHTARLALDAGIPYWGGEPDGRAISAALLMQGFSKEDLLADKILRLLPQTLAVGELTGPRDPRFESLLRIWVAIAAADLDQPPPFGPTEFYAWYSDNFSADFAEDPAFATRHSAGPTNRVAALVRAQSAFRDKHLLALIMARLESHRDVLVVFGGTHFVAQRRALTAALGEPAVSALTHSS
jgi:hypothetical protein